MTDRAATLADYAPNGGYTARHVNPVDESTPISRAADNLRHMIGATYRRIVGSPAPATVEGRTAIPGPTTREG